MDFPIPIHTIRMGLFIIYYKGSLVEFFNNYVLHSLKLVLIIANSAGPNEMLYFAPFHLGLHCLPKYPFRHFQYTKG